MVALLTLVTVALGAIGSLARINDIIFPKNGVQNQTIVVQLVADGYLTNENEVGVIFGYNTYNISGNVGEYIAFIDTSTNQDLESRNNVSYQITLPAGITGTQTIVGAVVEVVGAEGGVDTRTFNSTIDVASSSS